MKFRARKPRTDDALYRRLSRRLTSDEIVDRAVADPPLFRWGWKWVIVGFLLCALALYPPVHQLVHSHLEFILGAVAASLVQAVPGAIGRWRWRSARNKVLGAVRS